MAESQLVSNSNSGSSSEEQKDFRRKLPYDPAMLKRRKLWSSSDNSQKDAFGKMGKNQQSSTMMSHQGDRTVNPPDSKHKEGDTQKYNGDSRSHGARSNNGAGVSETSSTVKYPPQPVSGSGGLDDATHGRGWTSDSHSHSSRTANGGQGVRTTLGGNQQYPSQAIRGKRTGLTGSAQNGRQWNAKSESHAHGEREINLIKTR